MALRPAFSVEDLQGSHVLIVDDNVGRQFPGCLLEVLCLKHLVIQRDPSTSDFGVLQGGGKDAESPLDDFFQRNARPLQEIGDPVEKIQLLYPLSKVMANPFKLIPGSLAFCGFPSSTSFTRCLALSLMNVCSNVESLFYGFSKRLSTPMCDLATACSPVPAPMGHTFSVHMFSEAW